MRKLYLTAVIVWWALCLTVGNAVGGWLEWRMHLWCEVHTQKGVVLALVIRGQPSKLTDRERQFLNDVAAEMNRLEQPVAAKGLGH